MNLLKATFYDEFSCMGAECPLTCCGGWSIVIDEKTLKDYRMMGGEIGRFAKKCVKYDQNLQGSVVNLRETDGMCPMLDEDQLCKIVLDKGAEKLCRTCVVFPRETVRSYDTDEKYIFLGCPKAVQLLFEVKDKLTFISERDPDLNMENIPIYNDVMKINLAVREAVTDFIQNTELPLWFREFYGAYTIEKMSSQIAEQDFEAVEEKLEHFFKPSFYQAMYQGIKNTKVNREQQFQSLCGTVNAYEKIILGSMFSDKSGTSDKILQLLHLNRRCTFDEWNHAREEWTAQENEQQWENMLVYNWMRSAFAPQKNRKLLKNYLACVLCNLVAAHLLILYCMKHEADAEIRNVIVAFVVRRFLHGNEEIMKIMQLGMDEGVLSPTFLIYLCNLWG